MKVLDPSCDDYTYERWKYIGNAFRIILMAETVEFIFFGWQEPVSLCTKYHGCKHPGNQQPRYWPTYPGIFGFMHHKGQRFVENSSFPNTATECLDSVHNLWDVMWKAHIASLVAAYRSMSFVTFIPNRSKQSIFTCVAIYDEIYKTCDLFLIELISIDCLWKSTADEIHNWVLPKYLANSL